MPFDTPERLSQLIQEAISQDEEIRKGLLDASLAESEVKIQILRRQQEIWDSDRSEIEKYNQIENKVKADEERNKKHLDNLNLTKPIRDEADKNFLKVLGFEIGLLIYNLKKSSAERWKTKNQKSFDSYQKDKESLNRREKLLSEKITDESIKERIRTMINSLIPSDYGPSLKNLEAQGLAEVIDPTRWIDTKAMAELKFLIENMPGGSIGISGIRGAGKSTLIQSYCNPDKTIKIKNKDVLPVMSSAPVHYDAREFILYLFSSTCISVLEKVKFPVDTLSTTPIKPEYQYISNKNLNNIRRFAWVPIPIISAIFMIFFALTWISYRAKHDKPLYGQNGQVVFDKDLKKDTSLSLPKFTNSSITETTIDNSFYTIKIGSEPLLIFFFKWSILYLIICVVLTALSIHYFRRSKRPSSGQQEYAALQDSIEKLQSVEKQAFQWLQQIKFQQTFTTGWSGAFKLPFVMDGGLNKAITFSERQMTNPEIVRAFTGFLKKLTPLYCVVIGIDELDKLESDEDAQKFLNEIKFIFGVPKCFFLVTVSESAMNNFEKRGFPFRDVFDSSFDCIVQVNHFDREHCHQLLQRRYIGKPILFFNLAYCFAGGLPRDLIRYFREILWVAKNGANLADVTKQMVLDDLKAKIKSLSFSLKKLPASIKQIGLLLLINDPASSPELGTLLDNLQIFIESLDLPDDKDTGQQASIRQLADEFYSYVLYMHTLLSLFAVKIAEKARRLQEDTEKPKWHDEEAIFDRLTCARQLFALDHMLSRRIVIQIQDSIN